MYSNQLLLLAIFSVVVNAIDFRRLPLTPPRPTNSEPTTIEPKPIEKIDPEDAIDQNKNARYEFESNINDDISGLQNTRHEVRDGLKVEGQYSYSDGYFKRTVYYQADENGYRVIKQEEEPLSEDGPLVNQHGGVASISTIAHGAPIAYKVQSVVKDDDYVIEGVA